MLSKLANFANTMFRAPQINTVRQAPVQTTSAFGTNPFINTQNQSYLFYGQNKPIKGGLFAGYHNGKPNIVGQRLFIEV